MACAVSPISASCLGRRMFWSSGRDSEKAVGGRPCCRAPGRRKALGGGRRWLNLLAERFAEQRRDDWILTPHPGERRACWALRPPRWRRTARRRCWPCSSVSAAWWCSRAPAVWWLVRADWPYAPTATRAWRAAEWETRFPACWGLGGPRAPAGDGRASRCAGACPGRRHGGSAGW